MVLKIRAKDLFKYLSKMNYRAKFWKIPKFLKFYDKIDIYLKTNKDYHCFIKIFNWHYWLMREKEITLYNYTKEPMLKLKCRNYWYNLEEGLKLREIWKSEGE
jgi:hypothetical protein